MRLAAATRTVPDGARSTDDPRTSSPMGRPSAESGRTISHCATAVCPRERATRTLSPGATALGGTPPTANFTGAARVLVNTRWGLRRK